jgi:hypothetical protein
MRAASKNPHAYHNLEIVGNAFIKWMQGNGPEAYPSFQAMVRGSAAQKA